MHKVSVTIQKGQRQPSSSKFAATEITRSMYSNRTITILGIVKYDSY